MSTQGPCECSPNCRCDPEKCKCDPCACCQTKLNSKCDGNCKCGPNCKCDPCYCPKGRASGCCGGKCPFSCNGYRLNVFGLRIPGECIIGPVLIAIGIGAAMAYGYKLGQAASKAGEGHKFIGHRNR